MTWVSPDARLRGLFDAAVARASPARCLPPHLPAPPKGRTVVIGAGKAAAAMARAVEDAWTRPLTGLVVTRYGHGVPCRRIEVVEAAHPLSDAAGVSATRRMLAMLDGLTADDLVLCLLSGGGSALLTAPPPGVALQDERDVVDQLLRGGAPIAEINTVRKHLSFVKGGRMAMAALPARVVTLVISDVPGDDLSLVASGPTVQDHSRSADALRILGDRGVITSPAVRRWLEDPRSESPRLPAGRGEAVLIATPADALEEAVRLGRAAGHRVIDLGAEVEGEARIMARDHARALAQVRAGTSSSDAPTLILSGGETTVTVRGGGRGGRNLEYLLALAIALNGAPGVHALAADTDGIDGSEADAGAIVRPDTLARAARAGLNVERRLADNDAWSVFSALGDLVTTGPTRTNVNDFRAILIDPLETRPS